MLLGRSCGLFALCLPCGVQQKPPQGCVVGGKTRQYLRHVLQAVISLQQETEAGLSLQANLLMCTCGCFAVIDFDSRLSFV